jgi:hypothetical protein
MAMPFGIFILGVAWLLATGRYLALALFVVAGVAGMLVLAAWHYQRHMKVCLPQRCDFIR